ncbi:MAG: hypothetical protein ACRDF5_01365 [bacterium]
MIALDRRTRSYPVVLPDRRLRDRPTPRRRLRRQPLAAAMVVAALVIVPALLYVAQRTEAARTGYSILRLQRELAGLESEHARLGAAVSVLRAPQRIERIARTELGMVPPLQRQLAAITMAPAPTAQTPAPPPRSLAQRIGAWLGLSPTQAQAHEPAR